MNSRMFNILKIIVIVSGFVIVTVESMPLFQNLSQQQFLQTRSQLYLFPTNIYRMPRTDYVPNHRHIILYPSRNNQLYQRRIPQRHPILKPIIWNRKPVVNQSNNWNKRTNALKHNNWKQVKTVAGENTPGSYNWGYRWLDEFGNQMFREESSNGMGTITGRYSFRNSDGIIRIVEYIADHNGYRTRIRSNEPGIVTSYPANAEIIRFEDENNIPTAF